MKKDAELGTVSFSLHDAYENIFTGAGGGNDANSYGKFSRTANLEQNWEQLSLMYKDSKWSQKIVDTVPDDMTREWLSLDGKATPQEIEMIKELSDKFDIVSHFNMAQKKANQLGNAFLLLDIDDGQEPDQALNYGRLKAGCLRSVILLDRTELQGMTPELDAFSPNFNNFKSYTVYGGTEVHHSRVLVFKGKRTGGYDRKVNNYYDNSLLTPLVQDLLNLEASEGALAGYIISGNVDVFKLYDFNDSMQNDEDKAFTIAYAQRMLNTKSQTNAVFMDVKEELSNYDKNTKDSVDLYQALIESLSSKTGIPKDIFLGDSASGLNTDNSSMKIYYDVVKSKQRTDFSPHVTKLLDIFGYHLGKPDLDVSFEWVSLYQLDAKTQADIDKVKMETMQIGIDSGMIEVHHALMELIQDKVLTNVDEAYIEQHRKAFEELNSSPKVEDIDDEYNVVTKEETKEGKE